MTMTSPLQRDKKRVLDDFLLSYNKLWAGKYYRFEFTYDVTKNLIEYKFFEKGIKGGDIVENVEIVSKEFIKSGGKNG
jgi:hypothetical protein